MTSLPSITPAQARLPRTYEAAREANGVVVNVIIDQAGGLQPDTVTIEAAPGFVAVPREVLLEENETAVVRILEALLG